MSTKSVADRNSAILNTTEALQAQMLQLSQQIEITARELAKKDQELAKKQAELEQREAVLLLKEEGARAWEASMQKSRIAMHEPAEQSQFPDDERLRMEIKGFERTLQQWANERYQGHSDSSPVMGITDRWAHLVDEQVMPGQLPVHMEEEIESDDSDEENEGERRRQQLLDEEREAELERQRQEKLKAEAEAAAATAKAKEEKEKSAIRAAIKGKKGRRPTDDKTKKEAEEAAKKQEAEEAAKKEAERKRIEVEAAAKKAEEERKRKEAEEAERKRKEEETAKAEQERLRAERQKADEAKLEAELNRISERARLQRQAAPIAEEDQSFASTSYSSTGGHSRTSSNASSNYPYAVQAASGWNNRTATPAASGWANWGKTTTPRPPTVPPSQTPHPSSARTATFPSTQTRMNYPSASTYAPPVAPVAPAPVRPQAQPAQVSPPLTDWGRRQQELAKKQQEMFVQEQERLARARQSVVAPVASRTASGFRTKRV